MKFNTATNSVTNAWEECRKLRQAGKAEELKHSKSRKNKYRPDEVKYLYLLFPHQCTHGWGEERDGEEQGDEIRNTKQDLD